MGTREEEFLRSLQETFKVEATEHLQTISTGLLELEKGTSPEEKREHIETVFRAAHSLKGAARAVNFRDIESICQSMEDVLTTWRRGNIDPPESAVDALHRSLDRVSALLGTPPSIGTSSTMEEKPVIATAPLTPDTVRIPIRKLDAQLLEAEEMLAVKLIAGQRATELGELAELIERWPKEWDKVSQDVRSLAQNRGGHSKKEGRIADFFDWNVEYFKALESKIAILKHATSQDRATVGKLVDDLLEDSKKLLMLPASALGTVLPKIVRDLCRDQGKQAEFVLRGEDIEIDNRILAEMKDPLIHLVRNSVDHGVEFPEERTRIGKSATATITLALSAMNGNKVELELSDDGRGIDLDRVKEAAIKSGHLAEDQAQNLTQDEASALIFQAEVSTSPIITQLSGRGLGLAIVREKTEQLGGKVIVETKRNAGTVFRITLPMTLSTFRGILIEAGQRLYVIPTAQVDRVGQFKPEDIKTVENRETLSIAGCAIALVPLTAALGVPPPPASPSPGVGQYVILGSGDQRIAFTVDSVLDEQEVLVKPLRKPLSRVRNISGATILGSGQLAPVLNTSDLLKSARVTSVAPQSATADNGKAAARSILVVEDSITSRMLLKGILESAGYRVKTAVNGAEGFALLRAEPFELVVSDVEMPRLNGFELTAKIRADKQLAELPVILVTALETPEDRERGIDAGANAYLVKSSFDQSNLLEAVRRFV